LEKSFVEPNKKQATLEPSKGAEERQEAANNVRNLRASAGVEKKLFL